MIAEKYLVGELQREHLYESLAGASFIAEYNRQWVVHWKKIGKYEPPKPDSLAMKKIQDSLRLLNEKNKTIDNKNKQTQKTP